MDRSIDFSFPTPKNQQTAVGDIITDDFDKKYIISDRLWLGHKQRKEKHKQNGNGFGYKLFSKKSSYTSTLSARYYKDGSEILIDAENSTNPRKLTPRECARLQGFPDSFIINVSDNQAYRQFGNSVPVNVVRSIATKIFTSLDKNVTKNI